MKALLVKVKSHIFPLLVVLVLRQKLKLIHLLSFQLPSRHYRSFQKMHGLILQIVLEISIEVWFDVV